MFVDELPVAPGGVDADAEDLRATGAEVTIELVDYEFQRGGNQMMRIRT